MPEDLTIPVQKSFGFSCHWRFQRQVLAQQREMQTRQRHFIYTYMRNTQARSLPPSSKPKPIPPQATETCAEPIVTETSSPAFPTLEKARSQGDRKRCLLLQIFDTSPRFSD